MHWLLIANTDKIHFENLESALETYNQYIHTFDGIIYMDLVLVDDHTIYHMLSWNGAITRTKKLELMFYMDVLSI